MDRDTHGGKVAITVDGIDVLGKDELSLPRDRLLATSWVDQSTETDGRRLSGDAAAP